MKLCVPHPGHLDALKEIIKYAGKEVYEIYMGGSPDYIGTGRTTLGTPLDFEAIKEQTAYVHDYGIRMDIVLNSACLGGQHLTPYGYNIYKSYLSGLNDAGVDEVTIADPYLLETAANEFDFEVVASCIAFVDSPEKAIFYEKLGAEALTLDPNVNRDFKTLEAIKEATSCNIRLLVNEGCLYKCPFRYAHLNLTSHRCGPEPRPKVLYEVYQEKCMVMRVNNPELIIKANWIRPEDVCEYERMGIELFKISGRMQPVSWIVRMMEAYMKRSYHGNLIDMLDFSRNLKHLFYIPNDELEGVIEKWKRCDKTCYRCDFCKDLGKRAIRDYSEENKKYEKWK